MAKQQLCWIGFWEDLEMAAETWAQLSLCWVIPADFETACQYSKLNSFPILEKVRGNNTASIVKTQRKLHLPFFFCLFPVWDCPLEGAIWFFSKGLWPVERHF